MNKHAYLIMVHGSWKILEKLVRLLDREYNDIFLYIDKKVTDIPDVSAWIEKSRLFTIEPMDIVWAEYSQTECELRLLEVALKQEDYSYFHLLSGVDLPVKTSDKIYAFFEKSGKNFVGFHQYKVRSRKSESAKYYHPLVKKRSFKKNILLRAADRVGENAQRLFGVNRLKEVDWEIKDGFNWFSIRPDLARCVLSYEDKLKELFTTVVAPDEMFLQTVVWNTEFRDTVYDYSNVNKGSMRLIDWNRGKPYAWGSEKGAEDKDFITLMSTPLLFARKFDEEHMEIVEKIYSILSKSNK